ncbi:hypothetical protein EMA8858_00075 [Emticicia aquatica]|uniref:Uncharacterized protein n=1 Tax=Emticicia aquatica TaxID=1681835 RepID=A0ABM9AJS3_9BACT|nr:hypothetical protein [Emticicia aquatica]CAH0993970.1 hypothetical protein EMA8858_00075 [Emticicia aquatica]
MILKKFDLAPFELKAFTIFSLLTTFLSYFLPTILAKDTWAKTIKYTGWLPAMGYMFGLYFIFSLIYSRKKLNYNISVRWGIVAPLFIQIYRGLQRQLLVDDGNSTTNPYLMVSEYQYIWTVLIPTFWVLVILFSPNINKFCQEIPNDLK